MGTGLFAGAALVLLFAVISTGCGYTGFDSFRSLLVQAIEDTTVDSTENGVCGPIEFAPLIPDCPFDLVCFTTACETHNLCYGTCGASKTACDDQFYQDMSLICNGAFTIRDPELDVCRSLAITYWLAVATAGEEAFNASQDTACGTANFAPGACCSADGFCDDSGVQADCDAVGGAFVPYTPCSQLDCERPANDDCQAARAICEDQTDPADLGWCEDAPDTECSVLQQDCPDGSSCLAYPLTEYRCIVETDNLLATTDGPDAGGGCLEAGSQSFQADVWYRYFAPCDGRLTARMCGQPTYDAMLAIYGTNQPDEACLCPINNDNLLECDDDFCGPASAPAVVVEDIVEGGCYTIRVGGWAWDGTRNGARQGISELDIRVRCDDSSSPEPGAGNDSTDAGRAPRQSPDKTPPGPAVPLETPES
jgi:hypothetical protein